MILKSPQMKEDLLRFFYKRQICRKLVCKNVDILYCFIWQSIDITNQVFLRIRLLMRYFQTHIHVIPSSVFNSNCISNISGIKLIVDIYDKATVTMSNTVTGFIEHFIVLKIKSRRRIINIKPTLIQTDNGNRICCIDSMNQRFKLIKFGENILDI